MSALVEQPNERSARHPAQSAGHHAMRAVPLARFDAHVGAVVEAVAEQAFDSLDAVYVVDEEHAFLGAVPLAQLFRAPAAATLVAVMDEDYPRVLPHEDQEHAAALALARRTTSVAVVDEAGRLLGAIPARALLEVLREEHVEDLHRLAGIQREAARTRSALEAPPARRARHRLPWLLVGLGGSLLAAAIMAHFEAVLAHRLAVAFFVPGIVYLADAIGTQTEAIVIRGLSLNRLPLRHLLADELRTGLLIGVTLGSVALPIVALTFGDLRLAAAVSTAILAAGGVATTIGLVLPWALQRAGVDPAFGSGPVATIVQDVLSLVIYFTLATLIVGGGS